jgi:hypothetical protein
MDIAQPACAHPLMWMLEVNGLVIDVRQASAELQRLAYEKGLIAYSGPR